MRSRFRLELFVTCIFFFLTACGSPTSALTRLKISVTANGMYRMTYDAFQSVGVDLSKIDPDTLQLFRLDHEVAIRVQGKGSDLRVEWYGQANDSDYSAVNVYRLTWGLTKGKRMKDQAAVPYAGAAKESFQDMIVFSQPTLFVPQPGPLAQSWYWQALTAPMTASVPITLPVATPNTAKLKVSMWGSTQDQANPDHHIQAFFNNARVADEYWDGQGAHELNATVPAASVQSGSNVLRLVARGDTKAMADVVLLASVEMTYTRKFVAQQDVLSFSGEQGNYRLDGFKGDRIELYDVTNADEPVHVTNTSVGNQALQFAYQGTARRTWLAAGPSGFRAPIQVAPMTAAKLGDRFRGAQYVVVTYPEYVKALDPLIQRRSKSGLNVAVVTTNEVYDEFGYGNESPQAIRDLLDSLKPVPRYVLLVGKATYDSRDYTHGLNKNQVPTYLVETPHLNQAASDNWFASNGTEDPHPAFAIGRIPAKTKEQVAVVVNKIIAFETGLQTADWRKRAVFVADDKDASFTSASDLLAGKLAAKLTTQKVYLGQFGGDVQAARADVIAKWNGGAALLTYIGHGSIDTWAAGPLFGSDYLSELRNGDRLPILFTPTCLDGFFYHPARDSLAEDLLFKSDGGIIAGIVPTGLSLTDAQSELMAALFAEMYEKGAPTLGDAFLKAKQEMGTGTMYQREVVETFGLLGDPALAIGSK